MKRNPPTEERPARAGLKGGFTGGLAVALERAAAWRPLPWLLAAAFPLAALALVALAPGHGALHIDYGRSRLGSYLLAGLPTMEVARNMPLFEILFSLALNLGADIRLVYLALQGALCLLAWRAGRLLGGPVAGLLALCAAGAAGFSLVFRFDIEQAFYSWCLLLVLCLLLKMLRAGTLTAAAACGLAIGISQLVRTPLVLFPAVVVALDLYYARRRRESGGRALRRAALLCAAALLPLLPWGYLNSRTGGGFTLLDTSRAADNVITAALGTVYSVHGNTQRLAGLRPGESSLVFYAREVARDPWFHALTVLRRLWASFLYFPVMFTLLLLAFVFNRQRERAAAFALPLYLLLVHALLSIGNRYFYPHFYLLAPLLGWTAAARLGVLKKDAQGDSFAPHLSFALAGAVFVGALAVAYPTRAARIGSDEAAYNAALAKFPRDWAFWNARCGLLWRAGDDAGYRACLGDYADRYDDKVKRYFLSVTSSSEPAAVPLPRGLPEMRPQVTMEAYILPLFRQLELGDAAGAGESLRLAQQIYFLEVNAPGSPSPYRRDREVARRLSEDEDSFWKDFAAGRLLMWPPDGAAKILTAFSAAGFAGSESLQAQIAPRIAEGRLDGRTLSAGAISALPPRLRTLAAARPVRRGRAP